MLYALLESIDLMLLKLASYIWIEGYRSINRTLRRLLRHSKLDRHVAGLKPGQYH